MGMYDRVIIKDNIKKLNINNGWQTKELQTMPTLATYKIKNRRLYKQNTRHVSVPEEERPFADHEEFDNDPMLKMAGSMKKKRLGWIDQEYHGIFEIHDGTNSYNLKFTDGELVDVEESERY